MKVTNAQIAIGSICLIMAFAVTLQVRSVSYYRVNNAETSRAADLQQQLRIVKDENESLMKEKLELKDVINEYQKEAATNSDYSKVLSKQLERAELLAGLTAVEGTGIIVTMRDSRTPSQEGIDPNLYVIHDQDILWLVNELSDAGAEALAINGERIVATTEIRCAGATVSVNNNRYSAPFEITAIGDSQNMENALLMRDGVYDTLRGYGIDIVIKKASKVKINAFRGNITFNHAKPIQDTPKEAQ